MGSHSQFWVIVGGFVILGLLAMQTEQFNALAVVFFLLTGILPVVFRTRTALSLPYDGQWTVINGGVTEETSHS